MKFGALPPRARRRVVVTGVGAVTPLGHTATRSWSRLLAGHVGIRPITDVPFYLPSFITDDKGRSVEEKLKKTENLFATIPCKVAAPVMSTDEDVGVASTSHPAALQQPPATKTVDPFAPSSRETRSIKFAMAATNEALSHCGGEAFRAHYPSERLGISVGVGMAGLQEVADTSNALYSHETNVHYKHISPFFVPKILANMAAGMVAIKHGIHGPIGSAVTACATGAHNIGEAFEWISSGMCDAAVCGATESCITPVGIAGFCRMNAMSVKFNDTPSRSSRPFDVERCGFVMGEGAGMLVLEEFDSAVQRGANILCELRGFGLSSDAYHVASPHPNGHGASRCVKAALLSAGVAPDAVGYANAHATGTPMGDEVELSALASTLRPSSTSTDSSAAVIETTGGSAHMGASIAAPLVVSSVKGAMGHLLGAAGAVEAIATVMALHSNIIPPNVNLDSPIPHDQERVLLPTKAFSPSTPLAAAISTSFGFGGANAALVFTRAPTQ